MLFQNDITSVLDKHAHDFHPVVPFDKASDKIAALDLSKNNPVFTEYIYNDPERFSSYIKNVRKRVKAMYLIGGYKEQRDMYRRSDLFNKNTTDISFSDEPRSLHLGTDIWSEAGTKIYAPFGGMVHSFALNNNFGDYGATIILQHQLDMINFYTLYGHLSIKDIEKIRRGQFITRGENFARFGSWKENGNWPPHLHFQVIRDMGLFEGDYPGVCKPSESIKYLRNGVDPNLILRLNQFLKQETD